MVHQRRETPLPTKLDYAGFLDWCDEDTHAEWVDGEIVIVSPASKRHQQIVDFLVKALGIYTEARGLGTVLSAPFQMYLSDQRRGREPDLLFVSKAREHLLKENYLDGPADLVIEIVSPESRLRDRGEKFAEYEAAQVREYWLIDPEQQRADFYALDAERRYERRRLASHRYRSTVVEGFELDVVWLWQRPLPPTLDVLKALKLL